jgi:hypothetical protein
MNTTRLLLGSLLSATILACGVAEDETFDFVKVEEGKEDSSVEATILDFEFDGSLLTDSVWDQRTTIQDQLLYTIGQLNGSRAVGRLDKLELTNVVKTTESGKQKLTYHARMPVAWGSKTNLPTSYTLKLPKDVSPAGQEAFTTKYKAKCIDTGAHDVDAGSMWYYYRPAAYGCTLAATDVVSLAASVSVSTVNTTGKYPEYHKVWEDNSLKVVAVFGKYEDYATTSSDAGIAAYNSFVAAAKAHLSTYSLVTQPEGIGTSPGVAQPDVTFRATLPGGKTVEVVALLVDNVRTAGATFDARYADLSTRADVIMYNGHAGLGSNVRALARKGRFVAGQYLIMFMNGCDTYAYVDGYMAQTRAAINTDDPSGSKYMDIVVNGMPSYFASNPSNTMAVIKSLMSFSAPKTYEQIFAQIDRSQVVMVTGEHDNVYVPGYVPGGGGGTFPAVREETSASQGESLMFQWPAPAGTYLVKMVHSTTNTGGDADLYVKRGAAPTTSSYDCRPYADGSNEECRVTLAAAGTIYAMVNGYSAGENHFILTVTKEGGTTPPPVAWAGMTQSGSVTQNQEKPFATPALASGSYIFEMDGTGDADLYVRVGTAPTAALYDCRPYLSGSKESCVVTLTTSAPIHVMVRGYAASSTFSLVGRKQ